MDCVASVVVLDELCDANAPANVPELDVGEACSTLFDDRNAGDDGIAVFAGCDTDDMPELFGDCEAGEDSPTSFGF